MQLSKENSARGAPEDPGVGGGLLPVLHRPAWDSGEGDAGAPAPGPLGVEEKRAQRGGRRATRVPPRLERAASAPGAAQSAGVEKALRPRRPPPPIPRGATRASVSPGLEPRPAAPPPVPPSPAPYLAERAAVKRGRRARVPPSAPTRASRGF